MQKILNIKKQTLITKIEYIIDDVQLRYLTLRDENTNFTMELKIKFIEEHFIHNYCNTCHSRQGSTIKKPITIHGICITLVGNGYTQQ